MKLRGNFCRPSSAMVEPRDQESPEIGGQQLQPEACRPSLLGSDVQASHWCTVAHDPPKTVMWQCSAIALFQIRTLVTSCRAGPHHKHARV